MSAATIQLSPVSQRVRALRVLGVTPYALRMQEAVPAVPEAPPLPVEVAPAAAAACAVLLPAGCATRELDLLGRALTSYGAELARAARITVRDGQLTAAAPPVRAYLVFGEAQAHALGRELTAAQLAQAQIMLVDEPAQVLGTAPGKRRLWTALRQLRRALARTGG